MSKKKHNYYKDQLNKLNRDLPISCKFMGFEGESTNWLGVNLESIPELIKTLEQIQARQLVRLLEQENKGRKNEKIK